MSEGFFGRWSRRKQEAREEERVEERAEERVEEPEADAPPSLAPPPDASGAPASVATPELPASDAPAEPPPPTLADAQALTPESDFRPFVARNVAPEVKNTAFRKLFADPQFNVMDGMDIYIDDYSQSAPIPDNVLRQMASAKFLKLFDEEEKEEQERQASAAERVEDNPQTLAETPAETPPADLPSDVAQSEPPTDIPPSQPVADAQPASQTTDDHHADLRLQPDDAARAEDARHRTG